MAPRPTGRGRAPSDEGPRQVALTAIAKGQPLSELMIRSSEDAKGLSYPADAEPQIVSEYTRRLPPNAAVRPAKAGGPPTHQEAAPGAGAHRAFTLAFDGASSNGEIDASELGALIELAVAFGLAANTAAADTVVRQLAQLRGIKVQG